jgi:hypothetical protein
MFLVYDTRRGTFFYKNKLCGTHVGSLYTKKILEVCTRYLCTTHKPPLNGTILRSTYNLEVRNRLLFIIASQHVCTAFCNFNALSFVGIKCSPVPQNPNPILYSSSSLLYHWRTLPPTPNQPVQPSLPWPLGVSRKAQKPAFVNTFVGLKSALVNRPASPMLSFTPLPTALRTPSSDNSLCSPN